MASTGIIYRLIAQDSASRTFDRVGRAAGKTDTMLAKMGRTAKLAGEAVALGLAGGLAEGAKSAAKFQAEMTRISTQAGGTAKDVKVLSDQVLKLGTSTQQGPQALAESLYHLKSVGMDNVSAMKALKEASDLAAVGHANLEETTNALAGAWRTGIKGATSFHEAVSTVNAIIGAGNMSMDQFNAAIGTGILPSAKTFGLSMKQVGAALALMTDEGIDSASAATRLRMSFSLLGAPSGAAEKQLKKIGLTGLDLANAMRGPKGLIGAISLLKDHLDKSGLSASRQSQLLSRAFGGGRSSSGILLMLNNLDVLEKKQEQINRSTGRFDDAVRQQRKTAEAQWHLLTSNLEVMGIRVGTKVLPPVTDFVHFLATDAMPAAAGFGKAVKNMIPTGAIKKGFSEAKGLVSDFFGGLGGQKAPTLPTPMLKAPAVPKMLASPKSDASKLGSQIHSAIQGGIDHINWGKLGSRLGKGLGDAIGWVAKHAADFTKKIAGVFAHLDFVQIGKSFGASAIPLAIGFITSLFDPLFSLDFWKHHWLDTIIAVVSVIPIGRLASGLGKIFEHIPILKIFEPLLKGIGKLGGWIEKGLGKIFGPVGRGIVSGFKRVFPEAGRGLVELIDRFVLRPFSRFREIGRLAPRWLGNGIERGTAWVVEKALNLGKAVLRPFARAGGWLLSKGKDVVGGLNRGIFTAGKAVGRWVFDHVISPLVSRFARANAWLVSKGRAVVGGLKNGIVDIAKTIGGWVLDHIVTPVLSRFSRANSWLVSKGSALVSGFKTGIVNIAKSLAGWVNSHVNRPVIGLFKNAGSWLVSKGSALLGGLKSGIWGAMKGIGSWIKGHVVDPVVNAVKHFFGIRSPSRVFMGIGGHLVGGLLKGMSKTNGTAIAKRVFGSLPKALASIVKKGLVSVASLPGKALKALGGLGGDILGLLGFSSGKGGGVTANMKIGQTLAAAHGWTGTQWNALKQLWIGESGWNERALNKSSGAYGIAQALPASKYASAGSDWRTNAATQIKWGLSYIASRYGNPLNAYSTWLSRSPHWYAKGTGGAAKGLAWVGEKGAELAFFNGGEQILNHRDSMAFAKANGIRLPGYASGTILNASDRVQRDKRRVKEAKDDLADARRRHKGVAAAEKRLKAAEKELHAAEIALANAKRNAKVSISNTIKTGLLKKLETGSSSAIASAIKSLTTKLLNAGFDKLAKTVMKSGDKLQKLVDKRASIEKQIAAAMQYAADQASNIKDFLSISGTSATSVGDLISQMQGQQKTASNFVAEVSSLKARGASKDLLQQLSDAGPGSQLATILGAKGVTTADIQKLNQLVASGGKLATSFGNSMADMMFDSGKDAGKGFLAGLKSQEKALTKQIDKLAVDLIKAIKKALKIKSPSRVFRDEIGRNVVLGWVHGMDAHGHLVGAAAQRLADTATGVSVRRRYVPTAASTASAQQDAIWERLAAALEQQAAQPQHLTGQLLLDSGELLGVIKGTVQPMVEASGKQQAFRARVGRRG